MGWMIVEVKSGPPIIPGTYERDEEEQVRYLNDMLAVYEAPATTPARTAILTSPPTES